MGRKSMNEKGLAILDQCIGKLCNHLTTNDYSKQGSFFNPICFLIEELINLNNNKDFEKSKKIKMKIRDIAVPLHLCMTERQAAEIIQKNGRSAIAQNTERVRELRGWQRANS